MSRRRSVRHEVLLQLYGYRGGTPRKAESSARLCRREGEITDLLAAEVGQECAYLLDKRLVAESRDELSRDERRWQITSAGIDYVEEHLL